MKIYIMTDLEGVTGVFKFRQTVQEDTPEFGDALRLLMGDIAAVAAGLRQAGATDILVQDGHSGGNHFIPECMVSGVRYITGERRQVYWGLDASCRGVVLLGYHAMNGTPDGVLHHTQSSTAEAKYWYDGVERGEIYQDAVIAGHYNVPVMLVTGDEAACREARATLGEDVPTVAVKTGISRQAAALLAPEDARALLTDGARRAMAALPQRRPLKPKFPVNLRFRRSDSPKDAALDTPWFTEREYVVHNGLDILGWTVA